VASDNPTRKKTRKVDGPLPGGEGYWEQLRALALESGLDAVGVAPAEHMARAFEQINTRIREGYVNEMQFTFRNPLRSTTPEMSVTGAHSMIVGVRSYAREVDGDFESMSGDAHAFSSQTMAKVARYAWADHNQGLKQSLSVVMKRLRDDGHRAVVFADDNSIVDREAAYLAGIGWYGKNANLLLPSAGSFFVIGCVVTTAQLPTGVPLADGCGSCSRCIPACPTQAISSPGVIDGNRCLSWLLQKPGVFPREFRVDLHDRIYGCDDCQTSCPQTVRRSVPVQIQTSVPKAQLPARATIDIEWLLEASDVDVMSTCEHWYTHQRDPRWIRRNALIIIGNIGDPGSAVIRRIVESYLHHDDPMLRAHAVWAASRLGYVDALSQVSDDVNEMVRDELKHLPMQRSDA
jgi:epoxyqueuosine reductase